MLKLPNVTLCIIDCENIDRALFAVYESMENIEFEDVVFITSLNPKGYDDSKIRFCHINRINNNTEYTNFLIRNIYEHIHTPYVLIIRWDAFVLNAKSWDDRYMKNDCIGNSRMFLISMRMLQYIRDAYGSLPNRYENLHHLIHTELDKYFPVDKGQMTKKFSSDKIYAGQFGFQTFESTWFGTYQQMIYTRQISLNEYSVPKIAVHSGDMGDIVYTLPVMQLMGITDLILNAGHHTHCKFDEKCALALKPLIESEGINVRIQHSYNPAKVHVILDLFRDPNNRGFNHTTIYLPDVMAETFHVFLDHTTPWLHDNLGKDGEYYPDNEYIVINRSPRYGNPQLDWAKLLKNCNRKIVFLGMADEYAKMTARYPGIPMEYIFTKDLEQAKRIISRSWLFIGNQSALFSIAEGLKHPRILEVCPYAPNCSSLYSRNYLIKTANDVEYGNKIVKGEVML